MAERILIIVHGYPPSATGGAEMRAARTAAGLARLGFDVRVLAFDAHTPAELRWADTVQDGVVVRRLTGNLAAGQCAFRASYDNRAIGSAVEAALDEWRPALLHLFSGYLMSASVVHAASRRHVPVVVSLTDYWWFCHRITLVRPDGRRCAGPSPSGCALCRAERRRRWRVPAGVWPAAAERLWEWAAAWPVVGSRMGLPLVNERAATLAAALEHVREFVAPSRVLAEFYVRHGVPRRRIHVVRQGVEIARCPLRVRSDRLRFGFIGQVKPHKGVDLLLDAWSRLTGPRPRSLLLYGAAAGEEAYGERVTRMIARLPDAEWRGVFGAEQRWDVFSRLDVVVVPSRWVENSPNIILEAQAVGLPVVGTNIGGVAELVMHERNGLLFETDSVTDLSRQLQRLIDEPDLVGRLAHQSLPLRTLEDELQDLVGVYRGLPNSELP